VIVLCEEKALIWAIPHLLPQPPDFQRPSPFDGDTTLIAPLFTIPYPDDIDLRLVRWKTMSSWYLGSSNPLHLDALHRDCALHRFQLILNPNLTSASLRLKNSSILSPEDYPNVTQCDYTICENSAISVWFDDPSVLKWYDGLDGSGKNASVQKGGVLMGSAITRFALVDRVLDFGRSRYQLLSSAASGRVVLQDQNQNLVVFDF